MRAVWHGICPRSQGYLETKCYHLVQAGCSFPQTDRRVLRGGSGNDARIGTMGKTTQIAQSRSALASLAGEPWRARDPLPAPRAHSLSNAATATWRATNNLGGRRNSLTTHHSANACYQKERGRRKSRGSPDLVDMEEDGKQEQTQQYRIQPPDLGDPQKPTRHTPNCTVLVPPFLTSELTAPACTYLPYYSISVFPSLFREQGQVRLLPGSD